MSVKPLEVDVNPLGGGSSRDFQTMQSAEHRLQLTNGLLRIRWRRPSRNCDGWFGPDGSQGAIFVPLFTPPRSTIPIAEVVSTFIGIITYPPETLGESVFILETVCDQVVCELGRE